MVRGACIGDRSLVVKWCSAVFASVSQCISESGGAGLAGLVGGVMLETRSVRAADSVWASKPLPAPHAMANARHGKNAQVNINTYSPQHVLFPVNYPDC